MFYSLPTTWVRPDHSKGLFSKFRIVNPNKPEASQDTEPLDRSQVAFASMPNPSDPLSPLAPVTTQMLSVRIDDHIQTSQERFFENGVFPSVLVSIGKDPHPDVPSGIRPRLTGPQRRQVNAMIQKMMAGVHNYGHPAILDGMIERIDRLSATQNEMGWEKSEGAVRTRILSAFGVHPYILGEPVNVGGYAQAAKIEERFCKRVNTFLDMIGWTITNFAGPMAGGDDRLLVWWEKCEPNDPSLRLATMREGRRNGDVTRNEYRAFAGFPPVEEEIDERGKLLETVGGMTGAVQVITAVGQGLMTSQTAAHLFSMFFEIPIEEALQIVGQATEAETLEEATETLREAVSVLGVSPKVIAHEIDEAAAK
jgi:hypothetical protein